MSEAFYPQGPSEDRLWSHPLVIGVIGQCC